MLTLTPNDFPVKMADVWQIRDEKIYKAKVLLKRIDESESEDDVPLAKRLKLGHTKRQSSVTSEVSQQSCDRSDITSDSGIVVEKPIRSMPDLNDFKGKTWKRPATEIIRVRPDPDPQYGEAKTKPAKVVLVQGKRKRRYKLPKRDRGCQTDDREYWIIPPVVPKRLVIRDIPQEQHKLFKKKLKQAIREAIQVYVPHFRVYVPIEEANDRIETMPEPEDPKELQKLDDVLNPEKVETPLEVPENPIQTQPPTCLTNLRKIFCESFPRTGTCDCSDLGCCKRLETLDIERLRHNFRTLHQTELKEIFSFCKTSFPFFNKLFPILSEAMGSANMIVELTSAVRVCEQPQFDITHYKWIVNGLIRLKYSPKFSIETLLQYRTANTCEALRVILQIILRNRLLIDFRAVIEECVTMESFIFDHKLADEIIYAIMTAAPTEEDQILLSTMITECMTEEDRNKIRPELLMWCGFARDGDGTNDYENEEEEKEERLFNPPSNLIFKDLLI